MTALTVTWETLANVGIIGLVAACAYALIRHGRRDANTRRFERWLDHARYRREHDIHDRSGERR